MRRRSLVRRVASYGKQRDANEGEIVDALDRMPGVSVYRLDRPVDLLVGINRRVRRGRGTRIDRRNVLLEVKVPLGPRGGHRGNKPNPEQAEFLDTWPGPVYVVRSISEAFEACGLGPVAGG